MQNYREAAEDFKRSNPDGWYADPEWIGVLEEAMWERNHFEGVEEAEVAREWWRASQKKYIEKGRAEYAAEMVAIEKLMGVAA